MSTEDYEKWISEAWNDFKMADVLLKANLYSGSVFHSQQAVEKAIKAELKKYAKELDRHYITSRYPDSIPEITPKDAYNNKKAQSIYKKARSILNFIDKKFITRNGEENDANSC